LESLILLLSLAFAGLGLSQSQESSGPSDARVDMFYEPMAYEVRGVVRERRFFGPPGFGESPRTDSEHFVSVLELDACVDFPLGSDPPNDSPIYGVCEVQLFGAAGFGEFWGKAVLVRGSFFRRMSPYHFLEVVLSVEQIQAGSGVSEQDPG